ncbi:hypothetical protein N7478_000023 [Penicillium angulare]|uniref:uncharacterized protein n=1 Tax=Penicillium angulare TaxID=116970 RepID=UPI002541B10B|nr:uncharacterized protein N7478_000023 [Penicillium angulare]KAJ5290772.1 hypothetical protein N7478_000023 [Penicillium angulare]
MAANTAQSVQSVTVIGAGPCGCAFAADLASRGMSVLLYGHPDHRGALPLIERNDCWLNSDGEITGKFQIKTTSDMYLAIQHSPFIVITVPSYGQDTIVRVLSQFDLRQHTIIMNAGNFFYLAARQNLNAHAIMETDISPYAVRITGDTVFVKGTKKSLAIWMEPPTNQIERLSPQSDIILRRNVESLFSLKLVWCQNLLQVGLNNINPVVHCPAALMNTGWIESTSGDFYFYAQGMSSSVSKVSEKIDQERLAIARAYGLDLVDINTYMNKNYSHDREFRDYHDFAVGSVIHNKTKSAPTNMSHRYLLEDILYGMVPWFELGMKCGLTSPTIRSLIEIASVVSGFDYFEHGRSLSSAGLGESTKDDVLVALGGPIDKIPSNPLPVADTPPQRHFLSHPAMPKAQIVA